MQGPELQQQEKDQQVKNGYNNLLSKTPSTVHIPHLQKAKNTRRMYACFDSEKAIRMFGYRVQFNRQNMYEDKPDPNACKMHKPIHKFAQDILQELTKGYEQIPKYHTL